MQVRRLSLDQFYGQGPSSFAHPPRSLGAGLDAGTVLTTLFNQVEIHTTVAPPFTVDLSGAASGPPNPAMQKLLNEIKPNLIFKGPAGQFNVAPAGVPAGVNAALVQKWTWGLGAAVGGGALLFALIGFGLGYTRAKHNR